MKRKSTILIIDDTVDTVELLKKRLRSEGYETFEAYDGVEGLKKIKDCSPDVVVLDIMMPKLDGYEVCKRLKSEDSTKHIPILMLTAKGDISDKVKGLDIGADMYITKPFDYKEISARIRSLLTKSAATKELADRERAEALDQMVDEIAHEIRNPLVAIGGFARRVKKSLPEGDANRKYLETILQNVTVLEKMVNELVGLKSAALSYMEPANINEILQNALDLNIKNIGKNNIAVTTHFMESSALIPVDVENLTRALANIIENGIEAMDGEIRNLVITTGVSGDYFEITIADSGKGISRDQIKNIFNPFFSSKIYGPGLGLTFTLRTIQNHKGTISVESEEGKGTSFTIRLPKKGRGKSVEAQ